MDSVVIDTAVLTIGDLELFEEISGSDYMALAKLKDGDTIPLKMLTALLYVFGRKSNPELTLDDVKDLSITQLNIEIKDSSTNPQ